MDGVIEINNARAVAGGVTPGDSAGYPVTLSQPGSYRLTGSLSPSGVSAIAITANNVTLDLNRFRIYAAGTLGPLDGIDAAGQTDVGVMNGAVDLFAGDGISAGDRARIENVTARGNSGHGIFVGGVSTVIGCTAHGNGTSGTGFGISAGAASTVSGNTAVGNQGAGIYALSGSTLTGNTVNGNVGPGLLVGEGSTVSENTASSNGTANGADGIVTGAGCSVLHNTVRNNGGDGIEINGESWSSAIW